MYSYKILGLLTLTAMFAATLVRERRALLLNPVALFCVANFVMGAAIILNLDSAVAADTIHLIVIVVTSLLFFVGVVLYDLIAPGRRMRMTTKSSLQESSTSERWALWAVNLASLGFVLLYFKLSGGIFLLKSLNSAISGRLSEFDAASVRFGYYAGQSFIAPGFFNQFKNTLFPYSSIAILILALSRRKPSLALCGIFLVGLAALFLLGTGQRSGLVFFGVGATMALGQFSQNSRAIRSLRWIVVAGVVGLFVLTSVLLGRQVGHGIGDALSQISHRFLESNQYGALVAFRYINDLPPAYGAEWAASFRGLLPGNRGSDFSNQIYALLFGSLRGTTPYSIWGGIWLNFRWVGVILIPPLMGMLYAFVHHAYCRGPREVSRVCAYAALTVSLGLWVTGNPVFLLLNGAGAAVIWLMLRHNIPTTLLRTRTFSRDRLVPSRRAE